MTDILDGILDGVTPVNFLPATQNTSTILTTGVGRGIAPAFTPDALAASVKGRGLLKAGMPGHHTQALFDDIHAIDERIASFGPRPSIRSSIPALNDPTAPFNGKTIRGLLRDNGFSPSDAEACGSALDGLKGILPNMRRAILSASGSTRVTIFEATRILTQSILDELDKLKGDVTASALEEQAQREYDSHYRQLVATKQQRKEALAQLGPDAIANYCNAVEGASTAARIQNLEAQLMAAAKRSKA